MISSPVELMRLGFVGNVESFAEWTLFYADAVVRVIALDIPGSIGWKFSTITAASGYSQLATVLLQLCITASVVSLAVHLWRSFFRKRIYYATVKGLYWEVRRSPAIGSLTRVERIARETPCDERDKAWLLDFVSAFDAYLETPRQQARS